MIDFKEFENISKNKKRLIEFKINSKESQRFLKDNKVNSKYQKDLNNFQRIKKKKQRI